MKHVCCLEMWLLTVCRQRSSSCKPCRLRDLGNGRCYYHALVWVLVPYTTSTLLRVRLTMYVTVVLSGYYCWSVCCCTTLYCVYTVYLHYRYMFVCMCIYTLYAEYMFVSTALLLRRWGRSRTWRSRSTPMAAWCVCERWASPAPMPTAVYTIIVYIPVYVAGSIYRTTTVRTIR